MKDRHTKESGAILVPADLRIPDWQWECLKAIEHRINRVYVLRTGKRSKRKRYSARHLLYYALNLCCIRRRKVNLKEWVKGRKCIILEGVYLDSGWIELNNQSIEKLSKDRLGFIYACEIGLLRIPNVLSETPLLSHHHGDPGRYRGRPAGYYEIMDKRKIMGQVVQIMSNTLDGGKVVAYAETKVIDWSYKKTLENSYKVSWIVLKKAVEELYAKEEEVDRRMRCLGKIYRLPGNISTIHFVARLALSYARRIYYGIFVEKRWEVIYSKMAKVNCESMLKRIDRLMLMKDVEGCVPLENGCKSNADPFANGDTIVMEGIREEDYKGAIWAWDTNKKRRAGSIDAKDIGADHLAYPILIKEKGSSFLLTDMGGQKETELIEVELNNLRFKGIHAFARAQLRLTDPTVYFHNGRYYMFGNLTGEPFVLRLWTSESLDFCNYKEHPQSPILVSPVGGRMGGQLIAEGEEIYRFGQDGSRMYGDGLTIHKITELTESSYNEELVARRRFNTGVYGPHTYSESEHLICCDYYVNKFSALAWLRRIRNKMSSSGHRGLSE